MVVSLERVSLSNDPVINTQIRKSNKAFFKKIPDLIEIEEALCAGRIGNLVYSDNYMGSLAHYYDRNGFLTSPETGAAGLGQLGKLRMMIEDRTSRKEGTDHKTLKAAAESQWIGDREGFYSGQVTLKEIIPSQEYRTMVFAAHNSTTGGEDILLYRGQHPSFANLRIGVHVIVSGTINRHTTFKGVKQTSLKKARVT